MPSPRPTRLGPRDVLALDWPDHARQARGGIARHALVLSVLADHADGHGVCYPRQDRLATSIGCSPDTVSRIIDDLCSWGLLDRVRLCRPTSHQLAGWLYRIPAFPHVPTVDDLAVPTVLVLADPAPPSWFEPPRTDAVSRPRTDAVSPDPASTRGHEAITVEAITVKEDHPSTAVEADDPRDAFDDDVVEVARRLATQIRRAGHTQHVPRPDQPDKLRRFLLEVDRLLRIGPPNGGGDPDVVPTRAEVEQVIDWTFADGSFWRANIGSAGTFRRQWPKLKAQRERDNGPARVHNGASETSAALLAFADHLDATEGGS